MTSSPPASPLHLRERPLSALMRPSPRSSSRLSISSKAGVGSRASDDESRTAVKVAVRVRPPLKSTDPGYDLIPQRFQRSMVQTTSNTSLAIDSPQGRKVFVFDRVFSPEVMQDGIWEYLADSISAFTQGYNVSVLAYGQSGAGKSYTMGTSRPGEADDDSMIGLIPRAASALFEKLDSSHSGRSSVASKRQSTSNLRTPRAYQQNALGDRNWSLKATYVEIYNEQLRDLLVPDTTPANERTSIAIREDTKGNILLTGLRQVDINSVDDLMNALSFGSNIRQTDATAINAKSSRSHAVFSLNLIQRKKKQPATGAERRLSMPLDAMTGQDVGVTTDSKLHFVDLAGSERLKNTGAQGERAKEGISINAGLASLGKVISQLSSRQSGSHVSYRDSKLTRLLQDSLGGNAYTYMIACVTPAEFHLSETLNTVQYAQRARAIQSKPQIQQVDDGDSKALVERLRAEVSFLREQIRSSNGNDNSLRRASAAPNERPDRHNERESELQNQLLDAQENYSALSQRHARLISELARARENESEELGQNGDTSADDRLNRSNSFAQAVEQVVLEYEKTIQSLEQSLSSTRTTLSNTETSLLEKETKCAYIETINGQLQTRLQKLMDREASTENYLHDLEAKLDGQSSGEEKNATIITELRKEIARARENESACEDYISTLEERLAEADQDAELMQREVDRLEQVVERQRSLGKLDSLLYELDHVGKGKPTGLETVTNTNGGVARPARFSDHSRSQSHVSRNGHLNGPIPEEHDEHDEHDEAIPAKDVADAEWKDNFNTDDHTAERSSTTDAKNSTDDTDSQMVPHTRFVGDKLDTVTQELVDLRVEHESTVQEYGQLQVKYEETLRSLSELRDAVDEARHPERSHVRDSIMSTSTPSQTRPDSFISDGKSVANKGEPRSSLSRSLSSELSSAMEYATTIDTSVAEVGSEDFVDAPEPRASNENLAQQAEREQLAAEIERLRQLADEKAAAEERLTDKYAKLESRHNEALDMVEELKTQVYRARVVEATSSRTSTPVIRRKSSQNLLVIDRAHRSFASLRNIATENFENEPEVMQSFELSLNSAMHELHTRSERIQELEADIASVKKEMETKMTIISGLTRERSSLKASPRDMSMVANLRDQLERNDKQMSQMREAHAIREKELTSQVEELRGSLESVESSASGAAPDDEVEKERLKRIADMEAELADWEEKHRALLESTGKNEASLRASMVELEAQIAALQNIHHSESENNKSLSEELLQVSESEHEELIGSLRDEIDEYKAIIDSNAAKISELETGHAAVKTQLEELMASHDTATKELERHQSLVVTLEEKLASHVEATKSHEETLKLFSERHAEDMSEFKAREQKSYEEQAEVLMQEHAEVVHKLDEELAQARQELADVATQVAEGMNMDVSIELLSERIQTLLADQKLLVEEQDRVEEMKSHIKELTAINEVVLGDMETAKVSLAEMLSDVPEAVATSIGEQLNAVKTKLLDLEGRNEKNSRLVEELEEQLQNNFDEAQMTNNRLSTLQVERNSQLEEAMSARAQLQLELDTLREQHGSLQARFQELSASGEVMRSNSNSTIRKSSSHTSLPSPPPAIPLPPLPSVATRSSSPTSVLAPTSPTSGRSIGKETVNISQLTEDQEARIRTIERHLRAERQLTQTLEEALTDLEEQSNKVQADCETWKKRAQELETDLKELKQRQAEPQVDNRWSIQAVEEERKKRQAAELARKQLEERMNAINKGKKKKGSLNCF
ncbi:hypothetical protein E4U14_000217 [Claviceps sp. LM454 group G7]|nr:hypothetical protein E4U14_000217 [Claviceps sp. LM454 group G7]